MRDKLKRIMAVLVSVVVACSILFSGQELEVAQADTGDYATITVRFRENNASYGKVQVTTDGSSWADCVAGQAVSASAVKIVPNDGYEVAWGGISLRQKDSDTFLLNSNNNDSSAEENEIKAALISDTGYSLTKGTVYEVEQIEFTRINNTPDGIETSSSITLGETVLYEKGATTEAYNTFAEVSDGKIAIAVDNCKPRIIFDNYIRVDQTLDITGNASLVIKKGTTELKSITLGDHTRLDVDAVETGVETPANLQLTNGIHAADSEKPADSVSFKNNLVFNIGSTSSPAAIAFSGIGTVTLENYEFHKREMINTNIYAKTAFNEVGKVDIQCAKALVNATTTLFDRSAENETTDCTVYTEGQIQLQGAIGDGKLQSMYYFTYPEGAVSNDQMENCNVPDCMKTYVITDTDISQGIQITDSLDPGCTLKVNGINDITLISTDPILYSVSYQIDPNIMFPNPTCGTVKMNGFRKGFYTADGTGGHFEAWIAAGETVNVTILPDKGYQYQKDTLNINGQIIENATPGEGRGTYTFIMPANAGHICAGFAKTEDIVSVTNKNIASASIANTDNVITNGNAKLQITSGKVTVEGAATIASVAGNDYMVADILDVKLSEAVIKNYDPKSTTTQDSWDNKLHELDSSVSISMSLGESLRGGSSYRVVRVHEEKNEVQMEALTDVQYDTQTGTLTFPTDRFSIYAIAYKKTGETGGSSGDSSGGSQSGGSSSSSSGSSTPAADTTTDNTKTETKPGGTKVETSTDTKADGTKVDTTVETKTDGTKTETVVETAKDGSVKTTETVTNADGSATKTEKETETNAQGKEVAITTTTEKDASGKVTGITQTSEIDQIAGSASATVTVEKTADGKITSAEAEVDKKGASSKQGVSATLFGSVVSQITEAAGTKSVEISMTVTAGKKEYTVKADAQDLEAGNKLKVMAIDEKTGDYVLVNAKTYKVSKSGNVKVVLPEGMTYQLMDTKEAAAVEKQILNTVKVKKTAVTVEKGKKTVIQLSSKLDMDNVEKINYSTSKKSVATVNKNGTVTTKNSGKVTIQAKVLLKNGKTKTVKMTVTVKA